MIINLECLLLHLFIHLEQTKKKEDNNIFKKRKGKKKEEKKQKIHDQTTILNWSSSNLFSFKIR